MVVNRTALHFARTHALILSFGVKILSHTKQRPLRVTNFTKCDNYWRLGGLYCLILQHSPSKRRQLFLFGTETVLSEDCTLIE